MPTNGEMLTKNADMSVRYKDLLCPEGSLVAVNMIQDLSAWEKAKRPRSPRTLCQFISQTRYVGRTIFATADDISCYLAPDPLFGVKMPEDAAGRYAGWQFRYLKRRQRRPLTRYPGSNRRNTKLSS